jgi:hypothetical protein
MQPFSEVSTKDIDYIIKHNKLPVTGDKYLTVWNFILTGPKVHVPVSIADYILACNLQNDNIPVMTAFDIIRTNYKINDLDVERTIRIMKYLNKLDETDPFLTLPDEVIPKILGEFNCEQLLTLCKISKRFGNICRYYKNDLFDRFLLDKGFTIKEYKPEIICKALDLNKRISVNNRWLGNIVIPAANLMINKEGDVINVITKGFGFSIEKTPLKNIISVLFNGRFFYFLDSFGNVYKSGDPTTEGGYLTSIYIVDVQNIVQINSNIHSTYFLDVHGNVFKESKEEPVLNDIVKMFNDDNSFMFLNEEQDVYLVGNNVSDKFRIGNSGIVLTDITKSGFKNIKDILMRNVVIFTINNSNDITVSGFSNINYNLGSTIKIDESDERIYVLREDGLEDFHFSNIHRDNEIREDVLDFVVGDDYLTILYNSGDIELYNELNNKSFMTHVKGNILLLHPRYILIDGEIYALGITNDQLELIKIT